MIMTTPDRKAATKFTRQANEAWYEKLDFDELTEAENAMRGLV